MNIFISRNMNIIILLFALLAFENSSGNLINFRRTIICHLGYDALVYNGHGCWCGPGGDGEPIDEIDTCCKMHDACYDNSGCGVMEMYVTSDYKWECGSMSFNEYMQNVAKFHLPKNTHFWLTHRKVPMSELDLNHLMGLLEPHGSCILQKPNITCSDKNEGCHKNLCECDKIAVECFAKYGKPDTKAECQIAKDVRFSAWANKKLAELEQQEKKADN